MVWVVLLTSNHIDDFRDDPCNTGLVFINYICCITAAENLSDFSSYSFVGKHTQIRSIDSRDHSGMLVNNEPKCGRKSNCAKNSQVVFSKSFSGVAYTANSSVFDVGNSVKRVNESDFIVVSHCIDGKITPGQILNEILRKLYIVWSSSV